MGKFLNVVFSALIFGIVIYFTIDSIIPKIINSNLFSTVKENLSSKSDEHFEYNKEENIAFFITSSDLNKENVLVHYKKDGLKQTDTLQLNKKELDTLGLMYWISLDNYKEAELELEK